MKWVSPIAALRKKNGKILLCADLLEPNRAVVIDGFLLARTKELLHALNGATLFSKLYLAFAYHQVELGNESPPMTTFVTHEALFRFHRVCIGLASAPDAFRRMIRVF